MGADTKTGSDGEDEEQRANSKKPLDSTLKAARIARTGVVIAAMIAAAGTVTVNLINVTPSEDEASNIPTSTSSPSPTSAAPPPTSTSSSTPPPPPPTSAPMPSPPPTEEIAPKPPTFSTEQRYHLAMPLVGACVGYLDGYGIAIQTVCQHGEPFTLLGYADSYRIIDAGRPGTCFAPASSQAIADETPTVAAPCDGTETDTHLLWIIEPGGGDTFRVLSRLNPSMCLTAKNARPGGKPAPRFYACAAKGTIEYDLQHWSIVPAS